MGALPGRMAGCGPADSAFGDRALYQPHEGEQSFTRSLSSVKAPSGMITVSVEAHDKMERWTPARPQVGVTESSGDALKVQ